jgi:hypothetical protein
MKKLLFLFITVFSITAAIGQLTPRLEKSVIVKPATKIIKTNPAPPLAPAPAVNKETPPGDQTTLVYTLSSVRVNIKTGSDNKEFPSQVYVEIWKKGEFFNAMSAPGRLYKIGTVNEMAVNSNTELGLGKIAPDDKLSLSNLQTSGVELRITYLANIFLDAWKIENISCTLEFRDQNGKLHPTMGTKNISFSNAAGFLDGKYKAMVCTTDQNFNPLSANIQEWQ